MSDEKRARGEGHLYLRGNTWWCAYYAHGTLVRESTDEPRENEKKALKFLRNRLAEVRTGIYRNTQNTKYEQIRDAFYQDYEINGRKSLRHDGEGKPHLDKVVRLDEFFSGWRVSEIDTDSIKKFIAQEQKRELAADHQPLNFRSAAHVQPRKEGRQAARGSVLPDGEGSGAAAGIL
jgi:hypothetical protein